jgi:AcrR family transcriptional regulator
MPAAKRKPQAAASADSQPAAVRTVHRAAEAQAQILAAVDELFYREGARAVGVDAVVKRAGVNKMSLYRQFESKDALLLHYLTGRDQTFWAYFDASLAKHPGQPREQLLQFFVDLSARASQHGYRGCPFVNFAVEFPDPAHPARLAVAANKARLIARLQELARHTQAADADALANGLALLIEGAYAASQTYTPGHALIKALPQVAKCMLDAACGPPTESTP